MCKKISAQTAASLNKLQIMSQLYGNKAGSGIERNRKDFYSGEYEVRYL